MVKCCTGTREDKQESENWELRQMDKKSDETNIDASCVYVCVFLVLMLCMTLMLFINSLKEGLDVLMVVRERDKLLSEERSVFPLIASNYFGRQTLGIAS